MEVQIERMQKEGKNRLEDHAAASARAVFMEQRKQEATSHPKTSTQIGAFLEVDAKLAKLETRLLQAPLCLSPPLSCVEA